CRERLEVSQQRNVEVMLLNEWGGIEFCEAKWFKG
ncbi:hypothetical protein A2U01_0055073, partial [Trifolium medium]|nr:hypothetical protein [Trifolium medium]